MCKHRRLAPCHIPHAPRSAGHRAGRTPVQVQLKAPATSAGQLTIGLTARQGPTMWMTAAYGMTAATRTAAPAHRHRHRRRRRRHHRRRLCAPLAAPPTGSATTTATPRAMCQRAITTGGIATLTRRRRGHYHHLRHRRRRRRRRSRHHQCPPRHLCRPPRTLPFWVRAPRSALAFARPTTPSTTTTVSRARSRLRAWLSASS